MKRFLLLLVAVSAVLLGSCRKSEEPAPPNTVFGDWTTLAGADYRNVVFTTHYMYIVTEFGGVETGIFTMNLAKGQVTLIPDMPGAAPRTWNYTRNGARMVIASGAVMRVGEPAIAQEMVLERQVAAEYMDE